MNKESQVPMLRDKPVTDYPESIQTLYRVMVEVYVEANELKTASDEAAAKFNAKNAALVEFDNRLGAMLDLYDPKPAKKKKKA